MATKQPSLTGKLELARRRNSVALRDLEAPAEALSDEHIVASAKTHVPDLGTFDLASLATLTPRTPVVDGIAELTFEVVGYYSSTGALIGSFFSDGVSQYETPMLSITLVNSPAGGGNLLTCRVFASSVGPNYPGYYHVAGPGVSASFTSSGGSVETFSFVVPAGVAAPATITIHTDRDRIGAWFFFECAISQL